MAGAAARSTALRAAPTGAVGRGRRDAGSAALFTAAALPAAMIGPNDRLLQISPGLCELIGVGAVALRRLSWLDLTHPEDSPVANRGAVRSRRRAPSPASRG